ncbi:hypothetical protein D3C72_2563140 [compost metagenome]
MFCRIFAASGLSRELNFFFFDGNPCSETLTGIGCFGSSKHTSVAAKLLVNSCGYITFTPDPAIR